MKEYRVAYDLILDLIPAGSRVLDLGCGDGLLLKLLQEKKKVKGFGVEISPGGVSQCVEKGLYCYQGDIDEGLSDYKDNSFDYVIVNQTLQSTKKPDVVIRESLRIALNAVFSFPNFAYYSLRLYLSLYGRMPKNKLLPYEWYETPNIHLLTIKDFRDYCRDFKYPIKKEMHFSTIRSRSVIIPVMPNLFAEYGFFILDGQPFTSATL